MARGQSNYKVLLFLSFVTAHGVKPNEHSIGLIDHNLDLDVLFI